MRLLVHETLATAPISGGLRLKKLDNEFELGESETLAATDVGEHDFALIDSAEAALLAGTHCFNPALAVVSEGDGAIALRSPVRADSLDSPEILLFGVSGTAELLARATLWPFYGIRAAGWVRDAGEATSAAIVEGAAALESPDAGFSEDLVRAWFILTEQPVVTHVLVAPRSATAHERERMVLAIRESLNQSKDGTREIRKHLSEQSGLSGDLLIHFFGGQRYTLDEASRRSLLSLILRGAGGTRYPLLNQLPWLEEGATEEVQTG